VLGNLTKHRFNILNQSRCFDLRGGSQFGHQVKRALDKLSSRGQCRSPLKYTNCRLCISLERKVCPLEVSLGFHKYCAQVFSHRTNSWCQTSKKCYHVGIMEAIVHWLLDCSVKAEWTNFYSPPIKVLESFVFLTDSSNMKCSLTPKIP
jgi:hypothetical protein